MVAETSKVITIFYSYAHQDRALRDELNKHLGASGGAGQIKHWYDGVIPPGVDRGKQIDIFLNTADIILLLVSSDFMVNCSLEMKRAMERHTAGEARVIPVLLRPIGYENAPFSKLQSLPTNAKPITSWSNQDEAFDVVAKEIREVIEEVLVIPRGRYAKEQWLDIGDAHYGASRYEEALKAYEHVLQIDPNNLSAWIYKGKALYKLRRYKDALEAYERALQIDPGNFRVWFSKGEALYGFKCYNEAIVVYEQVLQINPDYVVAHTNKGNALHKRNRDKEALDSYEEALHIDPKYARAHRCKGDVLYSSYRYKEALAAYEEALRCDPTTGYVHHRRGKILERLGRSQEAQQAFEKAKELGYNG